MTISIICWERQKNLLPVSAGKLSPITVLFIYCSEDNVKEVMKMPKTSDLKMKDVINVLDGKRLGTVTDIELNAETGELLAIVIPQKRGGFHFCGRSEDVIIPWSHITKIGDCILVETPLCTAMLASKETPAQKDSPPLVLEHPLQPEFPEGE
jgi:YlmC/YmxH family sporulation protein